MPAEAPKLEDITAEAELRADSVLKQMTLRMKVAQMFLPAVYASEDEWTRRLVNEYADSCVGGIVLLKGTTQGASELAKIIRTNGRIPGFVAIDAEWGLAMRLADTPQFPANSEISDSVSDQLMYDYGREVARECRLLGINMVLGPVVDISDNNGFLKFRSLGNDPHKVAAFAIAYARGLEDGNVISVAKHFPGHGSVQTDSHSRKGVVNRSLNQLDSIDLYPYKKWVEQNLSGVMVGHLAVPAIDSEMRPAAVSPIVVTDLLRGDLKFKGLVITDAINMGGVDGYDSVDAIVAGADIVVAPRDTKDEINAVLAAVNAGEISEEIINERVRRILFYKYLKQVIEEEVDNAPHGIHSATADSISRHLATP